MIKEGFIFHNHATFNYIKMRYSLKIFVITMTAFSIEGCQLARERQNSATISALWSSDAYSIYADSVVQGDFVARVVSENELISGYKSPANEFQSPAITFKFSINGKDNEMLSGRDHYFKCIAEDGKCETPLIKFGQQYVDKREVSEGTYLAPNTLLKIRLDMSHILADFDSKGYYETFNGERIYKEDFKGVYVAGNPNPLMWDFDNLVNNPQLELKDTDGDGIFETSLAMNVYDPERITASGWKLTKDISAFPEYSSPYPLLDAMYNLSLEEMMKNTEEDGTFRTGKEWAGVWTRDISYSLILSMANLQPAVAKASLMRKVKNNRIIQDTGTGGAYPISTDRIVWAIAAWELYNATGDRQWLEQSYGIIKNSMEDDLKNAFDEKNGLFRGESSFLDWREQTYPEWMQPADIYESQNLGTNAVFYQANVVLSKMADLLGDLEAAQKYHSLAKQVKEGINENLWIQEKGYYGQYLYGRNYKILSPRSEALGEALAVIFDVADKERQQQIVASTPVSAYGIPSIFPQIPNIPPYHNNGIWPFVQSYWSLAAAKAGNEEALMESLSAIYRPAAFFLTNKENFVASTGDYAGTQINSDRQLWSIAGNLAMVYKVFFGIEYQPEKMIFRPFVPEAFKGEHIIKNFRYRNSVLDITIKGYGNEITTFTVNGARQQNFEIYGDISGKHQVVIELANNDVKGKQINKVADHTSPAAPKVTLQNDHLTWITQDVPEYIVIRNGNKIASITSNSYKTPSEDFAEYQVIAVDVNGFESFASEPIRVGAKSSGLIYQMEVFAGLANYPYRGFTGEGFAELTKTSNTEVVINVEVPEAGIYAIDFRYSNGSGPINTNNKAAIRTLMNDGAFAGTIVFPQRGIDEWSDWGFTNAVHVNLKQGQNTLALTFEPANENMHGEVNKAMADFIRLTPLSNN